MKTKVLTDFRICVGVPFMLLWARALVFLWGGTLLRGGSNSVFWGSFAGIGEINFFLGVGTGRWVILPWGFDIILIFPNFRRS